jgi:DNA-binding transcriptional MerR regulator
MAASPPANGAAQPTTPAGATAGDQLTLDPAARPRQKDITIGAVCKSLAQEFPDISISKIRYLEDQKLLSPRRTPGGYRLYSPSEVARLRAILRMQRDEFLPLRVIRQELVAGRAEETALPAPGQQSPARAPRASTSVRDGGGALYSMEEVLEQTKTDRALVDELADYGVVKGEMRNGSRHFDETERQIIAAAAELARYGVGGRNLRVFRSSADREASLLQQLLGPGLRSRNPDRRKEAVETLESLAAVTTRLKHLMLVADLRKLVR